MAKAKVAKRQDSQMAHELQASNMSPEKQAASGDMSGSALNEISTNNQKRNTYPHLGAMPGSGSGKF